MYSTNELKEFFKKDIFATEVVGIEILEAKNDYAKCMLNISDNHKNAKGIVMGGAIFSLADFTFAVAANQHESYYTVSTTSSISYLRPAIGKRLYAETTLLKEGKTVCFYEVKVYNEIKDVIAKASFSGTHIFKNKENN